MHTSKTMSLAAIGPLQPPAVPAAIASSKPSRCHLAWLRMASLPAGAAPPTTGGAPIVPSPATTVRRGPAAQQAQRPSRLAPAGTPPPHARTAAAGHQWAGWNADEDEQGAGQADLADREASAAAERQQLPADRLMPQEHAAPGPGMQTGCTAGGCLSTSHQQKDTAARPLEVAEMLAACRALTAGKIWTAQS